MVKFTNGTSKVGMSTYPNCCLHNVKYTRSRLGFHHLSFCITISSMWTLDLLWMDWRGGACGCSWLRWGTASRCQILFNAGEHGKVTRTLVFFLKTKLFKRPTVECHLEYESVKGSKLLFSFSDSVSVFYNFQFSSPLYACVNIELDIYRCAEYNISGVKLHMHIRTVSALHVLLQSNCPPIFTSTKVACLHLNDFMRYNSICHILNYVVLHLPMYLPSKHCHVMSQSHEEMDVILLVYRLIRRGRTRSHALPLCKT